MCLTAKTRELVAKKPIVVYKWLTMNNKSPFRKFHWKATKKYAVDSLVCVGAEILSFDSSCLPKRKYNQGFHSFSSKAAALRFMKESLCFMNSITTDWHKLVVMTIPKGATYVRGIRGDIVSTSIVTKRLQGIGVKS